uniref:Uncharacterized protein n=1 Tax=Siphoviridae sp. ctBLh2 TaxID=2827803 RepID=A0A8S5S355_9CAUD|nr:MAG TPA: hypothetical protein [Siphoviridae sp. ctBLh2]
MSAVLTADLREMRIIIRERRPIAAAEYIILNIKMAECYKEVTKVRFNLKYLKTTIPL